MQKGQPEVACPISDISLYRQWEAKTNHEGIPTISVQLLSCILDVF